MRYHISKARCRRRTLERFVRGGGGRKEKHDECSPSHALEPGSSRGKADHSETRPPAVEQADWQGSYMHPVCIISVENLGIPRCPIRASESTGKQRRDASFCFS